MRKIELNKAALIDFLEMFQSFSIKRSNKALRTEETRDLCLKGYKMVPGPQIRTLFTLPEVYYEDSKRKRYVTNDLALMVRHFLGAYFNIEVQPNWYGNDSLFLKPKVNLDKLSFSPTDKEKKEYKSYVNRRLQKLNKELTLSVEEIPDDAKKLYKAQEGTLIKALPKYIKRKHKTISNKDLLRLYTQFKDNRVFHPLVNLTKTRRKEQFPFESDLHASQPVLLANLIKEKGIKSPFTELVDKAISENLDVYELLAKSSNLSRSEYKKKQFKTLFGVRDSYIQKDKGYREYMESILQTEEYYIYRKNHYADFEAKHQHITASSRIHKFEKLFMRTKLTERELKIMSELAQNIKQPFISIHDAVAFKSKPSHSTLHEVAKVASKYNVRFSSKGFGIHTVRRAASMELDSII